jgi:hypothetical protein
MQFLNAHKITEGQLGGKMLIGRHRNIFKYIKLIAEEMDKEALNRF